MKTKQGKIENVVGAVLVGGSSRRMGQDKALLELGGQTLLERAIGVLETVVEEVVVVGPRRQRYTDMGVGLVSDARPGLGPVGGIHTALLHGAGRAAFVLACDMPFVTPDLVRWIVGSDGSSSVVSPDDRRSARPIARFVRDRHGAQPLCGLYTSGCLPAVERALDQGRLSAQDLLNHLESEYLELDTGAVWYNPRLLANINALRDFAEFADRQGQAS